MLICICGGLIHYRRQHELLRVDLKSFRTNMGWGYETSVDSKPFIRQQTIPAIAGNKTFSTEADALKTGRAVAVKLSRGLLPSLSKKEIEAMGVYRDDTGNH